MRIGARCLLGGNAEHGLTVSSCDQGMPRLIGRNQRHRRHRQNDLAFRINDAKQVYDFEQVLPDLVDGEIHEFIPFRIRRTTSHTRSQWEHRPIIP